MKRIRKIIINFLLILVGVYLVREYMQEQVLEGPEAPESSSFIETLENSASTRLAPPAELNIDLPFYAQAPHGNWDYPWQEACEEASILLVANQYLNMEWTLDQFNQQLLELVDYEINTFGAYEHTTVEQTVKMLEDNYGLKSLVHENPTFEDIQKIIASGHLIVAPMAGKLLDNPNFTNGGPTYHMLVIKGYDAAKGHIVTHDVGTRNGGDYVYTWKTIQNALHDWTDGDIMQGTPRIIEVLPKAA